MIKEFFFIIIYFYSLIKSIKKLIINIYKKNYSHFFIIEVEIVISLINYFFF